MTNFIKKVINNLTTTHLVLINSLILRFLFKSISHFERVTEQMVIQQIIQKFYF